MRVKTYPELKLFASRRTVYPSFPYFFGYSEPMAVKSKRLASKPPPPRKRRRRRMTLSTLRPFVDKCWRALRAVMKSVLASPPIIRVVVISTLLLLLWLGVNWAFHTFHKPSEILFPLDQSLNKHPVETWKQYESLFRGHATTQSSLLNFLPHWRRSRAGGILWHGRTGDGN